MKQKCIGCDMHHTRCKCTINARRKQLGLRPLSMRNDGIDGTLSITESLAQDAFQRASHKTLHGKWVVYVPRNTSGLSMRWLFKTLTMQWLMKTLPPLLMVLALIACNRDHEIGPAPTARKRTPTTAVIECAKRGDVVEAETAADCYTVLRRWHTLYDVTDDCRVSHVVIREWPAMPIAVDAGVNTL